MHINLPRDLVDTSLPFYVSSPPAPRPFPWGALCFAALVFFGVGAAVAFGAVTALRSIPPSSPSQPLPPADVRYAAPAPIQPVPVAAPAPPAAVPAVIDTSEVTPSTAGESPRARAATVTSPNAAAELAIRTASKPTPSDDAEATQKPTRRANKVAKPKPPVVKPPIADIEVKAEEPEALPFVEQPYE
jgi:hypothetical protein